MAATTESLKARKDEAVKRYIVRSFGDTVTPVLSKIGQTTVITKNGVQWPIRTHKYTGDSEKDANAKVNLFISLAIEAFRKIYGDVYYNIFVAMPDFGGYTRSGLFQVEAGVMIIPLASKPTDDDGA